MWLFFLKNKYFLLQIFTNKLVLEVLTPSYQLMILKEIIMDFKTYIITVLKNGI